MQNSTLRDLFSTQQSNKLIYIYKVKLGELRKVVRHYQRFGASLTKQMYQIMSTNHEDKYIIKFTFTITKQQMQEKCMRYYNDISNSFTRRYIETTQSQQVKKLSIMKEPSIQIQNYKIQKNDDLLDKISQRVIIQNNNNNEAQTNLGYDDFSYTLLVCFEQQSKSYATNTIALTIAFDEYSRSFKQEQKQLQQRQRFVKDKYRQIWVIKINAPCYKQISKIKKRIEELTDLRNVCFHVVRNYLLVPKNIILSDSKHTLQKTTQQYIGYSFEEKDELIDQYFSLNKTLTKQQLKKVKFIDTESQNIDYHIVYLSASKSQSQKLSEFHNKLIGEYGIEHINNFSHYQKCYRKYQFKIDPQIIKSEKFSHKDQIEFHHISLNFYVTLKEQDVQKLYIPQNNYHIIESNSQVHLELWFESLLDAQKFYRRVLQMKEDIRFFFQ